MRGTTYVKIFYRLSKLTKTQNGEELTKKFLSRRTPLAFLSIRGELKDSMVSA